MSLSSIAGSADQLRFQVRSIVSFTSVTVILGDRNYRPGPNDHRIKKHLIHQLFLLVLSPHPTLPISCPYSALFIEGGVPGQLDNCHYGNSHIPISTFRLCFIPTPLWPDRRATAQTAQF